MNAIQLKTFQELTLHELYSILKLRVDVFVVEQNCPYPEVDGADLFSVHFFHKEKEEVVAYLRVIPLENSLLSLFVKGLPSLALKALISISVQMALLDLFQGGAL